MVLSRVYRRGAALSFTKIYGNNVLPRAWLCLLRVGQSCVERPLVNQAGALGEGPRLGALHDVIMSI